MSSPRRGAVGNGALLLSLVVALAVVALVAQSPQPPQVSEFAPEAQTTIVDAPDSQSSEFGSGGGTCAGQDCTTAQQAVEQANKRPTIDVPRVRRCVGNPPRQTEDPQSPHCINYWDGDNGGNTWKGVTRDSIKIAYQPYTVQGPSMAGMIAHFNSRYEFYGRKLVAVPYRSSYNFSVEGNIADAVKVDTEIGPFAALEHIAGSPAFYEEMARRKIVTTDGDMSGRSESRHYARLHPYSWTYSIGMDDALRISGDWICQTLVGQTASKASPELALNIRKFGILHHADAQGAEDPAPLIARLKKCGAPLEVAEPPGTGSLEDEYREVAARFRAADVTSVTCICGSSNFATFMQQAATIAYNPEYLLTAGPGMWWPNPYKLLTAANQRAALFGPYFPNRVNSIGDSPWLWATREGDPAFDASSASGANGHLARYAEEQYQQLLLLATGIQNAGPNLTPESFARGLRKAKFYNPGAGGSPLFQAAVGFTNLSHAMTHDTAFVYWSEAAPSYDSTSDAPGGWCFVERGRRFTADFPAESAFSDATAPCR